MRLIIKKDEARSGCRKDDPKEPPRESIMGDMDAAPMEYFSGCQGAQPYSSTPNFGRNEKIVPSQKVEKQWGRRAHVQPEVQVPFSPTPSTKHSIIELVNNFHRNDPQCL